MLILSIFEFLLQKKEVYREGQYFDNESNVGKGENITKEVMKSVAQMLSKVICRFPTFRKHILEKKRESIGSWSDEYSRILYLFYIIANRVYVLYAC